MDKNDLVITDNDNPIALAGVMGGLDTEVTENTKNLLIESAYFDKVSIMNTSRRLNLISDASIRFERGIDFNLQLKAIKRFINIFCTNQDINYSSPLVDDKKNIKNKSVSFSSNDIYKILGTKIDNKFITKTLNNLDIDHTIKNEDIKFVSPSWRWFRWIDIIEEIAKHYGFNNFDSTLPIGNNRNNLGDYWNSKSFLANNLGKVIRNTIPIFCRWNK